MPVRTRTVTDAKVTQMQHFNINGSLDVNTPVASDGVSNALSGWSPLDALVAFAVGRHYGDRAKYEIQGTRVVAVQYYKVKPSARKLQADSSKDDKVKLADRTWQWYIGDTRGDPENERPSSFEVEVLLGGAWVLPACSVNVEMHTTCATIRISTFQFIASPLAASKLCFDPREFCRFRITYRAS
ncbi:hypothetical protein JB92DRAFT_3127408 [Gautieria morchelliformis]|nr:hypothetical protein JB92DRAFT_3127408 [Gautieria morchelliformis]